MNVVWLQKGSPFLNPGLDGLSLGGVMGVAFHLLNFSHKV
jgi:hypothetical protein